jgi:hypothetical protein
MEAAFSLDILWSAIVKPLVSLTVSISIGLIIGNIIEAMHWTTAMAKPAAVLVRWARLKDISGASFSMAFFSGITANTMLSEALEQGRMTEREVVISNLFNSLPTFFLHLPTIFFVAAPFLGPAAFVYVGLTLFAAFLRTALIVFMGHFLLPPLPEGCVVCELKDEGKKKSIREVLALALRRFRRRLPKVLFITAPIFVAFYFLKKYGAFDWLQGVLNSMGGLFSWLPSEALGVVVFHIAAESTAGLAAAGSLLGSGGLTAKQTVLALLSSPMRAVRHQFPYYAGIFKPRLAAKLIFQNQALRAASIAVVGVGYFWVG